MLESVENLLQFPCAYPIKAMGWMADDFDALVVSIVRRHVPELDDTTVETRHSRGGRYISITITIMAQSREQLDNIYADFAADKRILLAL